MTVYSFLPWLRTGLATHLTGAPGTAARASVDVPLRLAAETPGGVVTTDVSRAVQLYGPGDVIGVDPRAISRTEPRPWITNVEANFLAHIEFYDEDFPWRYSPAPGGPAAGRVAPWLALVVLAAGRDPQDGNGEFDEGVSADRPLPFITVHDPRHTLPAPDQLGAWAHVHVDADLAGQVTSDDMSVALPALAAVLAGNADNANARLLCPRRLAPDTNYHAFLVPAFETGRLAGLGLDPAGAPAALHPGWGVDYPGQPLPGTLPYYHRWFFTTGSGGDFESLVRLLRPRVPDERVGRRDLDVHRSPGLGLPGITTPAAIDGVLRLGGALRVPGRAPDIFDRWDEPYPHPFQRALATLINLSDDYLGQAPTDPVLTPPLYGRWHAQTARLLTARDGSPADNVHNWVHRLNLDPRFRVAASYGTRVVQDRQEEFMAAAWAQVGDVLAANNRIRAAQLAREVGHVLQTRHLAAPPIATARRGTGPAGAYRLRAGRDSVARAGLDPADRSRPGPVPAAGAGPAANAPLSGRALTLTAPAHSRVTTTTVLPGASGLVAQRTEEIAVGFKVATSRVGTAPVSPAMRRITRPGSRLMTALPFDPDRPADALLPRLDDPADSLTAAPPKRTPGAVVTGEELDRTLHPAGLPALPTSADFVITLPGDPRVPTPGGPDSPDAARFKAALADAAAANAAAELAGRTDERVALDVAGSTVAVLDGLRADHTVPKALLTAVSLPERLQPFAERFIEAMAYPVIDLPMYRSLLDQSVDTFVPNLNLLPPDTVTLLETNQEFIEAFLVGLNYEMGRELLWREYPTDQRGTPFRQFWDPRTAPARPGEDPAQRRERLYDIAPIDRWPLANPLGGNDNREAGGAQQDDLVLVIRGELLKKYPTAAIYAHKARWQPDDAHPDPQQERVPVDLLDPAHPSAAEIRLPLYEAKIEPDVYLLGFDLTADEARGADGGDAGWFFVIKERPGDPRFGLDLDRADRVEVWNDLSWPDVDPHGSGFITLDGATTPVPLQEFDDPVDDAEKADQHAEDLSLPLWHAGLSSADIAYILFQAPVLMAVHAEEMLP
ncbi:hypothetical protein ACFFWC_20255 [Plantactinospora siamensis]|uniref:Uncharacterized protein n=1 Tax=Plantactinospora siamensis TaxID=555372 RepID=A0ABV6P3T5_9ACTN